MARIISVSEHLELEVKRHRRLSLLSLGLALLITLSSLLYLPPLSLLALPLFALAARFWGKSNIYLKGLRGELEVLEELKALPDDYLIVHSLPIPGLGDLDLLVVGPTGIYAIEVKKWYGRGIELEDGTWRIDLGTRVKEVKSPIPKLKLRTSYLKRLGISAKPLMVMAGQAKPLRLKDEEGVEILDPEELLAYIVYRDRKFSEKELKKVRSKVLALVRKFRTSEV